MAADCNRIPLANVDSGLLAQCATQYDPVCAAGHSCDNNVTACLEVSDNDVCPLNPTEGMCAVAVTLMCSAPRPCTLLLLQLTVVDALKLGLDSDAGLQGPLHSSMFQ